MTRHADTSHDPTPSPMEPAGTEEILASRVEEMQRVAGRLARRLLRDPARADDVAQKAVLASLARPPRAGWAPIAWLSGITRNLVRKERRGDARRAHHERMAARTEAVPSTAELVVRLDEHRTLLAAVRALDEPCREAILLRYFKGMAPREIARSRGVPIHTVRSHLRRGLAQLRERLDASHGGDRRAWCAALLPLARGKPAPDAPLARAPSIPVVVAVAASVLAVVGGTVLLLGGDERPPAIPPAAEIAAEETRGATPHATDETTTLAGAPFDPEPRTAVAGTAWIAGRVTSAGRPVLGVRVTATEVDGARDGQRQGMAWLFEESAPSRVIASAVTDADGRFRLEGLAARVRVRVEVVPGGGGVGETRDLAPADLGGEGLALSVRPALHLKGRVAAALAGQSPTRITFRAFTLAAFGWEGSPPASTVAVARPSPDGTFDVALPAGAYSVSVLLAGRARWTCPSVAVPWEGEHAFGPTSIGTASLRGIVTDAEGRPIPEALIGASVMSTGEGEGHFAATTASDGTYRIDALPVSHVRSLRVHARGFGPLPVAALALPLVARETATFDVRLPREVVVSGRVLTSDGSPVVGAQVSVTPQAGGTRVAVASDAEGRFRVDGLPSGSFTLSARGAGSSCSVDLERIAEGAQAERDLVLTRGQTLRGRVVDASDRPVPAAFVTARSAEVRQRMGLAGDLAEAIGLSGGDGSFELEGLPPAGDWVLAARSEDAATLTGDVALVRVTPTEAPAPVVLRLVALGSIEGRVLDASGLGIGGAPVRLRSKGLAEPRRARTDPDGTFAFEGVPPGGAVVEATNVLNELPSASAAIPAVGEARKQRVELRVGLDYLAQGKLTDATGKPVVRGPLALELLDAPMGRWASVHAETDDHGVFQAVGLVAGTYRVKVRDVEATPLLVAGARGATLTLTAAGPAWVEGEVVDPEGRPVSGFQLTTWTYGAGSSIGSEDPVTGPHFRVKAPQLAADQSWSLSITAVRGELGALLDVQPYVIESVPTGPLHVRLRGGRTLTGRVRGTDGAPAAGAQVYAAQRGSPGSARWNPALQARSATSGADGSFRVTGLPEGPLLVSIQAPPPFLSPTEPIVVEAGRNGIDLRIERGREIRGTVRGPDGEPAAGFQVSLEAEGPETLPYTRSTVATDGSFRIEGIPPVAHVGLRVAPSPGGSTAGPWLPTVLHDIVVGGDPVTIQLRAGAFVEGTAVGPEGAVVSRGNVVADLRASARDGAPVFMDGRVDDQGRFRIGPMEPGPALLFYEGLVVPWASMRPLPIVAPAQGIRVPVAAAATLRGRVLGTNGGAGSARWNPGFGNSSRVGTGIGPDGTFSLPAAAEVPGLLYVAFPDDDRYALRETLVVGTDVLELPLSQGRRIEGRLTGVPPGKAPLMSVVARRGDLVCFGGNDPDGTFRIPSVPPGTYRVEIEYGPYAGAVDAVDAGATDVLIAATKR